MEIRELHNLFIRQGKISTDSRKIETGCIFFALKGETFNGNQYAMDALRQGACLAVTDEPLPESDSKIVRVENVLTTLQQLATFHRKVLGIPVLAITGSNGKTTTKELVKAVLSKKYRVFATQGNLNNHIGVPLTLLSMDKQTEFGIVEMGANHPGEINQLCEIALPDYGLITNIGRAHLEGFGSLKGVADAKGELFRNLIKHHKTIFLNEGNELVSNQVPEDYSKIIYYNGPHGIMSESVHADPFLSMHIKFKESRSEVRTNLIGMYNAENVLAACCTGMALGLAHHDIIQAIGEYNPVNNRSQLITTQRNTLVMDAYNANPSSMEASINGFLEIQADKKLLILGEMRELGLSAEKEHRSLINSLKQKKVGEVICIGELFKDAALQAGYQYTQHIGELKNLLENTNFSGYHILIKGSRSNRLEEILPLL